MTTAWAASPPGARIERRGWKTVVVIAKSADFTGPLVFSCHILEHEDMWPMGRFNAR